MEKSASSTGEVTNYNKELTKNINHTSKKKFALERPKKITIHWNLFLDVMFFRGPEGNSPLGRPRRIWAIILKWIFKKWEARLD